jgi:hypothetical protein
MNEKRMTSREVSEAVTHERGRLMKAIRAMGEGASTVRVTDEGWTAKDVLAHCIHWVGQIAWGMGARMEQPAWVAGVEGRPSGDDWNARVVAHYHQASLEQVIKDFDRAADALMQEVRARSDDQINATDAIPWGGNRPLWQQIGSETFDHWPEHTAAIEQAAARVR